VTDSETPTPPESVVLPTETLFRTALELAREEDRIERRLDSALVGATSADPVDAVTIADVTALTTTGRTVVFEGTSVLDVAYEPDSTARDAAGDAGRRGDPKLDVPLRWTLRLELDGVPAAFLRVNDV
jgi:hypothetical protein